MQVGLSVRTVWELSRRTAHTLVSCFAIPAVGRRHIFSYLHNFFILATQPRKEFEKTAAIFFNLSSITSVPSSSLPAYPHMCVPSRVPDIKPL